MSGMNKSDEESTGIQKEDCYRLQYSDSKRQLNYSLIIVITFSSFVVFEIFEMKLFDELSYEKDTLEGYTIARASRLQRKINIYA